MLSRIARKILLISILLSLTGGQWAVLQSAAWAGMFASRMSTQHFQTAMTTTFDGQHPCPLCKAIQSGRKSEKKSEVDLKVPRVEFPPSDCVYPRHFPIAASNLTIHSDEFAESAVTTPLLRPPRLIPV